ncbi:MAG: glycoside hydrolase family 5 protein, partial [Nitrososphaerales archaeon]
MSSAAGATADSGPRAGPGLYGVHVVHPKGAAPYLADAEGRFVLLRGVDDNALVQYPADYPEAPTIHRSDLAEMASLGFNFLRLPVSWSRIMPEPGRIDTRYLTQVASVVSWAKAFGIGVLVDMHEDNYSTATYPDHESDGAPAWAVDDDDSPCSVVATTTQCALSAFKSFWSDSRVAGRPLQQWYLEAAKAVAKATGADTSRSNVVGVELMNEPWPSGPSPFEQQSLYPFYDRMISGLRKAGVVAPIWFEPSILRNATNNSLSEAKRFSHDPDLVYAVHIYTGVFSSPFGATASLTALAQSYASASKEAAVFGTPFMVDEFGSSATPEWNTWLAAQLQQQNAYSTGSGFWLWKQREGRWDNWAVVHLDGSLRSGTLRAQLLSQPHVDSVPGDLLGTTS